MYSLLQSSVKSIFRRSTGTCFTIVVTGATGTTLLYVSYQLVCVPSLYHLLYSYGQCLVFASNTHPFCFGNFLCRNEGPNPPPTPNTPVRQNNCGWCWRVEPRRMLAFIGSTYILEEICNWASMCSWHVYSQRRCGTCTLTVQSSSIGTRLTLSVSIQSVRVVVLT